VTLPAGLRARLAELFPGAEVGRVVALRDDESSGEQMKALGYGRPLRVELAGGRAIAFHTARPDDFGHDRRADRVGNLLLAYDSFGALPHHVPALDMGVVRDDGALVSLAHTGEPYLVTAWVDGALYADDLRRVQASAATPHDVVRAEHLARVLLEIHAQPGSHPGAYTRAIRDLLGHGEGIFGLVDSYDGSVVPATRLRAIEEACLAWRWRLRDQTHRLRRTHGDFHPFNILFDDFGAPQLLDTSRGSEGDPADDVACLTINYVFFGARPLWDAFWREYLARDTVDVCAAVAPFFAWRALVLASPKWYPHLAAAERERILAFAERALAAPRFDPATGWPFQDEATP
jgi:aminoglycoside phosphotransferase (APT) family kinase protein